MIDPDRSTPSRGGARDRDPRLSAAILRISRSLDLATVLQEVVDSVRALTGARHSVITTIDEGGQVRDFVTSGLTEEERGELMRWPDGFRLFEHLRDMPEPLRVTDLGEYLGALGLSNPFTSKTLRGAPLHQQTQSSLHLFVSVALRRLAAQIPADSFPLIGISGANPPASLQSLPEVSRACLLIAPEHRLGILPAAKLA